MDQIINDYLQWWKQTPVMSTVFTVLSIIIIVMGTWQLIVGSLAWLEQKGDLKEKAIASYTAKLNYPNFIWVVALLLFAFLFIAALLQQRF